MHHILHYLKFEYSGPLPKAVSISITLSKLMGLGVYTLDALSPVHFNLAIELMGLFYTYT